MTQLQENILATLLYKIYIYCEDMNLYFYKGTFAFRDSVITQYIRVNGLEFSLMIFPLETIDIRGFPSIQDYFFTSKSIDEIMQTLKEFITKYGNTK